MQLPLSRASMPRTITAAGDIYPDDEVVILSSAASIGVGVPSASGQRNALYIYSPTANDVIYTLTPLAGTINSAASFAFTGPGAGALLIPDGISNWLAVGQSVAGGLVAAIAAATAGAAWGSITGTLLAQTDLQAALDAKLAANAVLRSVLATTVTYNNTAALASTALSLTVEAGKTYFVDLVLFSTSAVSALLNDFGGTATFTSFIGQWYTVQSDDATVARTRQVTSAGADYDNSNGGQTLYTSFRGTMVINAGGTFILRGAQDIADISNTSILAGSAMVLTKTN